MSQISFDSGPGGGAGASGPGAILGVPPASGIAGANRPSSSSREKIMKQIMHFNQSLKLNQPEMIQIIDQRHHNLNVNAPLPRTPNQNIADAVNKLQEEAGTPGPIIPERVQDERRRHYKDSIDYMILQNQNFIYSELPSSAR